MLTFAFMHHPYLVCILFGMPFLHLFTFLMFFLFLFSCIYIYIYRLTACEVGVFSYIYTVISQGTSLENTPTSHAVNIYMYIYTVNSQGTSLENTPTSHAVSLALFMRAWSDSANMLLCHALAHANGFCLHLLVVHGGVKKVFLINCMQLQAFHIFSHTFVLVRHMISIYTYMAVLQELLEWLF